MKMFATLALILLLPFAGAFAQSDSLRGVDSPPLDNRAQIVVEDTAADSGDEFHMARSPLGAVLRSAIIPGWGQFYTENYLKIPVILGVTGFLVYGWITEHQNYAIYRDRYDANKDLEPQQRQYDLTESKLYREFYRNRRDTYIWWFGVTYLLQLADAFVDAHMYDFDVSDEMQVSFRASPGGALSLQVRW